MPVGQASLAPAYGTGLRPRSRREGQVGSALCLSQLGLQCARWAAGGGIGGSRWVGALLPRDFQPPADLRRPEYVTTIGGEEWCFPTPHAGTGAGEEL